MAMVAAEMAVVGGEEEVTAAVEAGAAAMAVVGRAEAEKEAGAREAAGKAMQGWVMEMVASEGTVPRRR